MLVATLLAVGAFLLPQELPLEWYPLNHPGPDIHLLELTFAARQDGEVKITYDTGRGFNDVEAIRLPVSTSRTPYTYTFPLPDAPLQGLRLHPLPDGGELEFTNLRIINRDGAEIRRFHRGHLAPIWGLAAITPAAGGWILKSNPGVKDPVVQLLMAAPEVPRGMKGRNLRRCLLSTGYVAGMLGLILLTAFTMTERPTTWRGLAAPVAFLGLLAVLFAAVANRGLIRNAIQHAGFRAPAVAPGLFLELDLASERPSLAQLFWDTGSGLSESESQRINLEPQSGRQTLRFALPPRELRHLRFDPATGDDRLTFSALRVTDQAGRTRAVLPPESLEAERDIAALRLTAEGLRVQTQPGAHDPILRLSPAAVAAINGQRRAAP